MNAAAIVGRLTATGLALRPEGDNLVVSPRDRLTDDLLELLRKNKAAILKELAAEFRQAKRTAKPAADIVELAPAAVAAHTDRKLDLAPLSPTQEAARQDVIARLKANPMVQRAFMTRWENDTLIVTLAIRGVGTGELMIPSTHIGRNDLTAYRVLLDCLEVTTSCDNDKSH